MKELVDIWLTQMYDNEIDEVMKTISNERVWELGFDGKGKNPHTRNIEILTAYVERLEILKEELE